MAGHTLALDDDHDRKAIAVAAALKLEALLDEILATLDAPKETDAEESPTIRPAILKAVALRGRALARAGFAALEDGTQSTVDLARIVDHG
jgi:hypothetical protein